MNGMVNLRIQRRLGSQTGDDVSENMQEGISERPPSQCNDRGFPRDVKDKITSQVDDVPIVFPALTVSPFSGGQGSDIPRRQGARSYLRHLGRVLAKFSRFIGPGFMVSVAYIDPGNYSTDVAAGASTRFKLLFIVLMSNVFAILLQSLAVRLGTVTGLNLAEHCRAHLPRWLNIVLYVLGEGAIIATDIAEVGYKEHRVIYLKMC